MHPDDDHSLQRIREALEHTYNGDPFQRVIYTESHDEVANGRARVPMEVAPDDQTGWLARKRSTLGAALVFTAPGIPMIFQGQEFLQGDWFKDTEAPEWEQVESFGGIVQLYRDLIALRRNTGGVTRGLCGRGIKVHRVMDEGDHRLIAFHRWDAGGPGDDVIVVANFADVTHEQYGLGVPAAGVWPVRFNSDARCYSEDYGDVGVAQAEARPGEFDGYPCQLEVNIGPWSVLILSQDRV